VVMAWAECPEKNPVHHGCEPEPNLALSPHLAHKGCTSQSGAVGIGTQARFAAGEAHCPFADGQRHAIGTAVANHAVGHRFHSTRMTGLVPHS
jgi:hypothetical protein